MPHSTITRRDPLICFLNNHYGIIRLWYKNSKYIPRCKLIIIPNFFVSIVCRKLRKYNIISLPRFMCCWNLFHETHWLLSNQNFKTNFTSAFDLIKLFNTMQWSYYRMAKSAESQARPSGEILNYMTLVPQARQATPSGENLNYLLSR